MKALRHSIDKAVDLPINYVQFNKYCPFKSKNNCLVADLPFFYPKTPYLAKTVIFSRSDIEKLDLNPELITKFEKQSGKEIEAIHQ